jgi:regulator of protease activity HflC (stomatin/prohibitin superfamily)
MKKTLLVLTTVSLFLTSCYRVKPDADEESVLVSKPYFFGHGGVDPNPVSAGAEWVALTTDHVEFNITPQAIDEDQENVMTKDNTPLTVNSTLQYRIQAGNTPILYKKFGVNWFQNSISPTFYSMIRNKCSDYKMFDLASDRDILVKIQNDIFDSISNYTKSHNIPVDILQVTLGRITPPDEVIDETKKTAAQNQGILTQVSRAQSELARKQADINKAIADQAYQKQMGMTIDQYLKLRQLEITKEQVELIKDNKNISIIFGNANPVFPITK